MLGSGTLRMIKDCKVNKFKDPIWKVKDNSTTVVFPGVTHNRTAEGISKNVINKVEEITEGATEDVKDKLPAFHQYIKHMDRFFLLRSICFITLSIASSTATPR